MKFKKLVSVLLVGAMVASLASLGACGKKSDADADQKITIWTFTEDLKYMGEKYTEETGIEVELNIIATDDYPTKLSTAMMGGSCDADIIVGEPQMLDDFFDNGFFYDLDELGAGDYEGQIVDYVWERGKDSEGVQRAISYQITPAGFYYRRDIANEVFGTEDPAEIGKIFADYASIVEAGETLKAAGYRIFASDSEVSYFSGDQAWVVDGTLNVAQCRLDYMDLVVELYQKDLTAYAAQWSTPWYQAMAGEIPVLSAATQWGVWAETEGEENPLNIWDADNFNANKDEFANGYTEVFAFGLPSWGVLTLADHVGEPGAEDGTYGKWGICAGPAYGYGGGTFVGIASTSDNVEGAWEFIKWATLNEETSEWWIMENKVSKGDAPALVSQLEKHKNDANEVYGGQNVYALWLDLAKGIDYSKVTRYDKQIGDLWGNAISKIKTGDLTKEEAIAEFYDKVESDFAGEIKVNR